MLTMNSPSGHKRHIEGDKDGVEQKACKMNDHSLPSQVRLLKDHVTKIWLKTGGSHGSHEFTNLDEEDELVKELGLRNQYTLLNIGDLSVTMLEHDLVVDMLRHLVAGEEDSSITVKKTNSVVKITIKELSYDSESDQIYIRVETDTVSADKSDEIEDLACGSCSEVRIFSNDKAFKWCHETSSVQACPMGNGDDHFIFYQHNYCGWDATDNCPAFLNSVAAFKSNNLYLYASKKEVHLLVSSGINLDNLKKQKPMLFRISKFSNVMFFESFAHKGYFMACDQNGKVFMKEVGQNKTSEELEKIPEIQFDVQEVTPVRETSI